MISTHAPRAGSDLEPEQNTYTGNRFQPTLPVRGATGECIKLDYGYRISTHAPRAGSDSANYRWWNDFTISTHAPRAGSDRRRGANALRKKYFNPRSPCGERHLHTIIAISHNLFQPTLPVRGATRGNRRRFPLLVISTHAPRAGSDIFSCIFPASFTYFNPRSPCGERPAWAGFPWIEKLIISTHAPRAGSDGSDDGFEEVTDEISTHAPRAGSDVMELTSS